MPYNGLFSLCANFPKVHKCAHNPGRKIYPGLPFEVRLWITIVEFGVSGIMSRSHLLTVSLLDPRRSTIAFTYTKIIEVAMLQSKCGYLYYKQ